jgi:hypothetical protein
MLTNAYKVKRVEQLRTEWLREIALEVFATESEATKKRKALFFVEIWRDQQAIQMVEGQL